MQNLQLLFQVLSDQAQDFTRIGVPPGLEFGIYKRSIDGDLEPASVGRGEGYALNLWFEVPQQFICQAHGPVSKVSNRAVNDRDFHKSNSREYFPKIILLLE
jgi:hypothetical protein